jgi:hypothetical protein
MHPRDATRRWVREACGVGWVVVAAVVVLIPALRHGASLGPFDDLSMYGLTTHHGVMPHIAETVDQIAETVPWAVINWVQVHQGHLPLWNSYNALGLPQAFNWQAGSFSLPALVSYLGPLRYVYTVQLLVTLVVAGTGAYVLGRVLGLGVVPCALAGTVFQLGGAFFTFLGWPLASVAAWGGWILAACVLALRGRHRLRSIVLLAACVAGAIYAGQPDMLSALALVVGAFVVAMLGQRARALGGSGPIRQPLTDIALGALAGAALAAPLLLPGTQLISGSVRSARAAYQALPARDLIHLLTQNYDGTPVAGSQWPGNDYLVSAMYVGVIVLVLAVVALGIGWRRPEVRALAAVLVVGSAAVFVSPLVHQIGTLPVVGHLALNFLLVPLSLSVAVLGAIGLDVLAKSWRSAEVRRLTFAGFVVAGILLAGLWFFGRGNLTAHESTLRSQSFLWPTIEVLFGLAVTGLLSIADRAIPRDLASGGAHSNRPDSRWGRRGAVALLACETVFLVVAGAPMWTSSASVVAPTAAPIASLQRAVGDHVLAFGQSSCFVPPTLGILPEANILYGIHEFDAYDPMTPSAYFTSWYAHTGGSAGVYVPPSAFCPAVTTAADARLYGIGFVLEPGGAPGPSGAVFVERVGAESLYEIPGAAAATVTPLRPDGRLPASRAPGAPVAMISPSPSTRQLTVHTDRPVILRLRLTDVAGWHATIDGRPLLLSRFAGIMLEAVVPPGHHVVVLHYWPTSFTVGLVLAGMCTVALAAAFGWSLRQRQYRHRQAAQHATPGLEPPAPPDTAPDGDGHQPAPTP